MIVGVIWGISEAREVSGDASFTARNEAAERVLKTEY